MVPVPMKARDFPGSGPPPKAMLEFRAHASSVVMLFYSVPETLVKPGPKLLLMVMSRSVVLL